MYKHVHFALLLVATAAFLFTMRMYAAPLVLGEHDYVKEARYGTVIDGVILDVKVNSLHSTFIMKESLKAFALYVAFVVLVVSHRSFYPPNRVPEPAPKV